MGNLTVTHFDEHGKKIEAESEQGWKVAKLYADAAYERLDAPPLGVIPGVLRDRWQRVMSDLRELRSDTNAVVADVERFTELGMTDAYGKAIGERDFRRSA